MGKKKKSKKSKRRKQNKQEEHNSGDDDAHSNISLDYQGQSFTDEENTNQQSSNTFTNPRQNRRLRYEQQQTIRGDERNENKPVKHRRRSFDSDASEDNNVKASPAPVRQGNRNFHRNNTAATGNNKSRRVVQNQRINTRENDISQN